MHNGVQRGVRRMRKPGDTKPLKFRTTNTENKIKTRKIILAFTAIVLVIALMSLLVIFKETGFGRNTETELDGTNMKNHVTILFGGTDTGGDLVFLTYLDCNTKTGTVKLNGVSPLSRYERQTFNEILGGEEADDISRDRLTKAVGERFDVSIDRYVLLTEENIGKVLLKLGYYDITLEEEFQYEGGTQKLHLLKGEHSLNGNEFYTYLKYVGGKHSIDETDAQAKVLADWLNQVINPSNYSRGQTLYETLVNTVNTNVSISDFAQYTPFLERASDKDNSVKAQKTVFDEDL